MHSSGEWGPGNLSTVDRWMHPTGMYAVDRRPWSAVSRCMHADKKAVATGKFQARWNGDARGLCAAGCCCRHRRWQERFKRVSTGVSASPSASNDVSTRPSVSVNADLSISVNRLTLIRCWGWGDAALGRCWQQRKFQFFFMIIFLNFFAPFFSEEKKWAVLNFFASTYIHVGMRFRRIYPVCKGGGQIVVAFVSKNSS